ncbi:MAG TPA: class I SAM-dependent methyltransferase [Nitrososphaeraceae archaeon]|nr:class I SAM-dependent methyltransferase [Nitrososphaeraceae archaeon]
MSGLGLSYWKEVIIVLRSIIPVYDKVNKSISLGQDDKYRELGMRGEIHPGDLILDAGSGFGNMSSKALEILNGNARIILHDPIREMLNYAQNKKSKRINLSSGVFENMPFKESSIDAVLCGYSLRDSFSLVDAISEVHRVLKNEGRFIIVDIGKPDNIVFRTFVKFYLKYILGIIAYSVSGKSGLRFKTLYGTFLRWPKNSVLNELLIEKFSKVRFTKKMFGGAIIVVAYK